MMGTTISTSATTINPTEAFRDHYPDLHHLRRHIVPLDFQAARTTLPESHVWPTFTSAAVSDQPCSIPVIDLKSNYNIHDRQHHHTAIISQACETWGAFQIVNHGVPLSLLDEAESAAHRLFSLPTERKLKALREPSGVTGYGMAKISPFFDKYMWHEGFTIMGSPALHAAQLWPTDFASFCELMENYQKRLQVLAHRLTTLILKSLNVSEINDDDDDDGEIRVGSPPFTALQLNSYPPCPDPTRAMGLAPHTDTSLLTILYQSRISGLEIFKEGEGWVPVRPIPGALVVDVGDLLHIVSNGRFRNVLHRVVVNEDRRHRLSVAYFHGLPMDSDVKPIVRSGEVARFRPVTVKEFIAIKAKNLENALSLITI